MRLTELSATFLRSSEYYRGESKDRKENAARPTIFRKDGYSLRFEKEYYSKLYEQFKNVPFIEKIKKDYKKPEEYYNFRLLGVLQHYGYATRLLDITSDEKMARYFACSGNYDKTGVVYTFSEGTKTDRSKGIFRKITDGHTHSITRKIECVMKADDLEDKSVYEAGILEKGEQKGTITDDVIVGYDTVLPDHMRIRDDNLRMDNQHGGFILFGFNLDKEFHLADGYPALDLNIKERIPSEKKLSNLIELMLDKDEPIYGAFVYPDRTDSMDLIAQYQELAILKELEEDTYEKQYQEICGEYLKPLGDDLAKWMCRQVITDREYIMKKQEYFCFLFDDLLKFIKSKEGKEQEVYESYEMYIASIKKAIQEKEEQKKSPSCIQSVDWSGVENMI